MGFSSLLKTIKIVAINNLYLLLFNILIILSANMTIVYVIAHIYVERAVIEIERNIVEYEEVDLEHICRLHSCLYITYDKARFVNILSKDGDTFLKETSHKEKKLFQFSDRGYITNNFNIGITYEREPSSEIIVDYDAFASSFKQHIFVLFIIFVMLNIGLFIASLNHHNKHAVLAFARTRTESYSNSIIILTENIHHELNTPLAVISNKVSKLEKRYVDYKKTRKEMCKHCDLDFEDSTKDFNLIRHSIYQMNEILHMMKLFKGFKRNDDSSLYDIIEITSSVLLVSQEEKFLSSIDERLKEVRLDNKYLSAGSMTTILLNMIKNSIDAEGSVVKFTALPDNDGFYIADNGNGINPKDINKIYDEDFSTKHLDNFNRGNGLFINKSLLAIAHSSIELVKSDKSGTIFKIQIHTSAIETEKEKN